MRMREQLRHVKMDTGEEIRAANKLLFFILNICVLLKNRLCSAANNANKLHNRKYY